MHRIVITAVAALLVGTAAAQFRVASATPEDVARALAESPGPWAEAAIELVVGRGLYIGYPDGSFGWRDDITRAEMAVVIARLVRAYGLEDGWVTQDAEALAVLRAAAEELRADLAGLAALVAEQGATLEGLAGALGRSEAELGALREAVSVLQAAPAALDAAALRPEIERPSRRGSPTWRASCRSWAAPRRLRSRSRLPTRRRCSSACARSKRASSRSVTPVTGWPPRSPS